MITNWTSLKALARRCQGRAEWLKQVKRMNQSTGKGDQKISKQVAVAIWNERMKETA